MPARRVEPAALVMREPKVASRNRRGASPRVVHADPPALDPMLDGDAALRRIGLACLDHLSRNETAALAGMPAGIHQMRVAVRRLRAILSGFSERLPQMQRHWAFEELRWLADALGTARNLDVFESALLKPALRVCEDPPALAPLRHAAERQRRDAHGRVVEALRSDRYAGLIAHLRRWFESCGWRQHGPELPEQPVAEIAARLLQRRWRKAKKRGKGFATQSPAQRHRLRIALKKLRYTAETLASLYPSGEVTPLAARLKRLQDELGDANDVRVGHEILAALAAESARDGELIAAGERMLAWHERRLSDSEPKMRRHLSELFETEPFWHH